MKLFGVEMIPQEIKGKITKEIKSIRLFGKDLVPRRKKRRSAVKKTRSSSTASPPDPLPFALLQTAERMGAQTVERIGGRDWVFLASKILEQSDVDIGQNRFFFPKSEVLWWVLSEEERRAVEGGGGVEVEVVDRWGGKYSMRLKKWTSLNKIVLNCGWRKLVEDNGLRARVDCVELWSFRADSKLCFALNVKRENTINH